jgi:hypothetical protein
MFCFENGSKLIFDKINIKKFTCLWEMGILCSKTVHTRPDVHGGVVKLPP